MTIANGDVSLRPPAPETTTSQFAEDVAYYLALQPRQLPSRYLYDPLGSALFDAICHLPWYRVTRAETQLLTMHAAEIFGALDPLTHVVELGSGSGEKLVVLLTAGRRGAARLRLHLIDVSKTALEIAARALSTFDAVSIVAHQAPYEVGLEDFGRETARRGRTLALFLGSNLGNFDPPAADAILRQIRASLRSGDAFLLGADLVKPERELLLAYDDPLGVTAAFNRNLLVRINRELGANFDLDGFIHRAVWNAAASRIEMHLVSTRPQRICIPVASVETTMEEGEAIWTESSYKYQPDEIATTLERCGFVRQAQWTDADAGFALTLAACA